MYVGITRAQEDLHITYAKRRQMWGEYRYSEPSRFIFEIPRNLLEGNFGEKSERQNNEYSSTSTFKTAAKNLGERQTSVDRDKPVSNSTFGKNFVAPVMKDKPVSNSGGFGKNFVAPQVKKKEPSQQIYSQTASVQKNEPKKEEFKNVISGVEQARLMAQRLREQKSASPYASQTTGFRKTAFNVGDKVSHEKFGVGKIQSIVNIGNSTLYKIEFEGVGIKAVDAEFNRMNLVK